MTRKLFLSIYSRPTHRIPIATPKNNPLNFIDPQGLDESPIIIWPPPNPFPSPPPPPVQPPNLTPWNLLGWGYGRYCGYNRAGPGLPIDTLDKACLKHDRCWWTADQAFCDIISRNRCNKDFCRSLKDAASSWCDCDYGAGTPGNATCKQAATQAQWLFCYAGTS